MRWITAGLVTALLVVGCGGAGSSAGGSSSQVPTLRYTSTSWAGIYAHVSNQSAGDNACKTEQGPLARQVRHIRAALGSSRAVAGQIESGVLVAFEHGSPAFPSQSLGDFLDAWASGPPFTSSYVNQPDTGDEYNHAPVVICIVKTR